MRRVLGSGLAVLLLAATAEGQSSKALSQSDYTEIYQLYARGAQAMDSNDKDAYGNVFTEDGVWTIDGVKTWTGRDAIASVTAGPRRAHPKVAHFYSNILVDPAPEGAKGSFYVLLIDLQKNPAISEGGYCEDVLAKTKEGWRFKKRVCYVEHPAPAAPSPGTSGPR